MSSILNDVKHALGILPEDTAFDPDVILQINSAFGTLTQIGVGPVVGFQITGVSEEWNAYYTDPRLNAVKSYIILKVKSVFDPPPTGFATEAMARQITEMEFRLNVVADYG